MSDLVAACERYRATGIWTGDTPRSSCAIPERPLLIQPEERDELDELCRLAYKGFVAIVAAARGGDDPQLDMLRNGAKRFPDGPTLPPAIRLDLVRTSVGPRIVEADPSSAICLGETAALVDIWKSLGFVALVEPPSDAIARAARERGEKCVTIPLPNRMGGYRTEQTYLADTLWRSGVRAKVGRIGRRPADLELSAFMEDNQTRRFIERLNYVTDQERPFEQNPLWGSLYGVAGKDNLALLRNYGEPALRQYLPAQYDREALAAIDDATEVVCKPCFGRFSSGIQVLPVSEARALGGEYVIQELLQPRADQYGRVRMPDGNVFGTTEEQPVFATRLSVYAALEGMVGAQATARLIQPGFNNVHGQADAIQAPVEIDTCR